MIFLIRTTTTPEVQIGPGQVFVPVVRIHDRIGSAVSYNIQLVVWDNRTPKIVVEVSFQYLANALEALERAVDTAVLKVMRELSRAAQEANRQDKNRGRT